MRSIVRNDVLYFEFSGELDNMKIAKLKPKTISLIDKYRCSVVKLDFFGVTFVDSTGIGFVLARYNQVKKYGGELVLLNVNTNVKKVFALSGLFSIIKEEKSNIRKEVYL